jgi:haloacetate dehalogenase
MTYPTIPGFVAQRVRTTAGALHVEVAGDGEVVVLLHGFPETSLMWRDVAPLLAQRFRVVAVDLPGYGRSDVPAGVVISKRALAAQVQEGMAALGVDRYALVGHDRGGRVAYRAALDRPDTVSAVAVLDIVPTSEVWDRADDRFALAYWPFSLLAQPAPLPERLVAADPAAVVESALEQWGSASSVFPADVRAAYVDALRDPVRVHAICEEYRAAAGEDRQIDSDDQSSGRRITVPLYCLWSESGPLGSWYQDAGGPLGIWKTWADDVRGSAVDGGHFFPEEHPETTAALLTEFLDQAMQKTPGEPRVSLW